MNNDLSSLLVAADIWFEQVPKRDKVKLFARWRTEFGALLDCARAGVREAGVSVDQVAEDRLNAQPHAAFFLLPGDASGLPSVRCAANPIPDLAPLVCDTATKCEEIVVVDEAFNWSFVLVNHGVSGVGKYFQQANT